MRNIIAVSKVSKCLLHKIQIFKSMGAESIEINKPQDQWGLGLTLLISNIIFLNNALCRHAVRAAAIRYFDTPFLMGMGNSMIKMSMTVLAASALFSLASCDGWNYEGLGKSEGNCWCVVKEGNVGSGSRQCMTRMDCINSSTGECSGDCTP